MRFWIGARVIMTEYTPPKHGIVTKRFNDAIDVTHPVKNGGRERTLLYEFAEEDFDTFIVLDPDFNQLDLDEIA